MNAPRLDLYAPIHKALRAWMFDTIVAVGRIDGRDEPALKATLRKVEGLLAICASHIEHENDFLHRAMERHMPGSAREADLGHQAHHRQMTRLRGLVAQVQDA